MPAARIPDTARERALCWSNERRVGARAVKRTTEAANALIVSPAGCPPCMFERAADETENEMVATRRGTDTRAPDTRAPGTPTKKAPNTQTPVTKAPAGAGLSTLSAAVNCLNGSVGVGVLGLPLCDAQPVLVLLTRSCTSPSSSSAPNQACRTPSVRAAGRRCSWWRWWVRRRTTRRR